MVFLMIWELGYRAEHLETFSTYLQHLSTNYINRRPTKEIMMLGLCLWKGCFEWCMVIIYHIAFRCQTWQLLSQTAGVQADRQDSNINPQKILWGIQYNTISMFDYMKSHKAAKVLLNPRADNNSHRILSLNLGEVSKQYVWTLLYSLLKWRRFSRCYLHIFTTGLFHVSVPVSIPETIICPSS